jgi:hypothetical protein
MKTLWKIVGGILICLVLALLVLRVTGFEPRGCSTAGISWTCTVPGLWLRGNLVTTPVADWSYTDQYQSIKLQTRTWYLLPHSVTIWCIAYDGQLYVATSKAQVRQWPRNVARDPHVRLKIGNQLFDRVLVVVTDPVERAAVLQVRAKKYSQKYPPPAGVTFTVYHVMPG